MSKVFIPHEQALELKELGFDEPCFGYWSWVDVIDAKNPANNTKVLDVNALNGYRWYSKEDGVLIAPMYQQAFRWFREKYGYMGKVDAFFYPLGYTFRIDNLTDEVIVSWGEPENDFDIYEEAELACLKKLIEIVKPKL